MTSSRLLATARRLATLLGALLTMLVMAPVAAFAEIGDKGSPAPLSDIEKVGFFVVIPVALLVALLVIYYRPGSGGSSRYRPQRGWDANDAWFGITPSAQVTDTANPVADPTITDEAGGSRGSW